MKKILSQVFVAAALSYGLTGGSLASEHETHGVPEPSPRGASQIVNLLLSKAGQTIPLIQNENRKEFQETVLDLFSEAIATEKGNTISPPRESSVSARCQFMGASTSSNRDELCFVVIKNLIDSNEVTFIFQYSTLGIQSVSNVSVQKTE